MFARAFGIERRHQEGFLLRADQQQAGAFVGMRVIADQPIHVRSGGERNQPAAGFIHLGAQGRKACFRVFCHGVSSSGSGRV
ncbi:hypothetical protein D3C72_2408020 [compost metagenome]